MLFEEYMDEEEYLETLNELLFNFIDSLDLETLSEEQAELLDELLEFATEIDYEEDDVDGDESEDEEELEEALRKRVVRKGKIVRKLICKPGFKSLAGKCVKMAASERRIRKKMAKRGAKKRRSKKSAMLRHRARSMKIAKRIA
jgi:hypothetical protein